MSEWLDPQQRQTGSAMGSQATAASEAAAIDQGLRSHMLKVYNYMASGVLLTGIVAMLFAQTAFAQDLMMNGGIMSWVILLSPLAIIFTMNYKRSEGTLQVMFWVFAVLMGLSMSRIFMIFFWRIHRSNLLCNSNCFCWA